MNNDDDQNDDAQDDDQNDDDEGSNFPHDHVYFWLSRVEERSKDFEEGLEEGEVMVTHVLLSGGSRIAVQDFSYHGPFMAIIDGWDAEGRFVSICTHYASIQVLFTAIKKTAAEERPKLGFRMGK